MWEVPESDFNLVLFSYVDNGTKSVRFLSSSGILQKFRNPHGCKSETKRAEKEKGMTFLAEFVYNRGSVSEMKTGKNEGNRRTENESI